MLNLIRPFTKTLNCNTHEIDKIENINSKITQLFIECVKKNNKVIQIENSLSDTIKNNLDIINTERVGKRKRKTKLPFFLVPLNYKINGYDRTNSFIIETEYLQNEIIFGYKTEIDEPGILIVTNENGLKDKNNLRFSVVSIGFFPDKSYCLLKIDE